MSSSLMQFSCWLVVLATCVDRGDGRWKPKDSEKLEHDIVLFRKIAETVEHEIEDFYEDTANDESVEDNFYYWKGRHGLGKDTETNNEIKDLIKSFDVTSLNASKKIQKDIYQSHALSNKEELRLLVSSPVTHLYKSYDLGDKGLFNNSKWPKFEDILLTIGKRYDWKNDRWIKVKKKFKPSSMDTKSDIDRKSFLSKHKFIYRFVKLNKIKSKRNIVLAVKAVR